MNILTGWEMHCLVNLLLATKEYLWTLQTWHPMGKFLYIKGVVLFDFWQAFALLFCINVRFIESMGDISIQDIIVCVDMLFFATVLWCKFTYQEYLPENIIQADMSDLSFTFDHMTVRGDNYGTSRILQQVGYDGGMGLTIHPLPLFGDLPIPWMFHRRCGAVLSKNRL